MVKKNKLSQEERDYDDTKNIFQAMSPGTLTLLAVTGFVITLLVGYGLGGSHVMNGVKNNLGIDPVENFGGKAYELDLNQTHVAECIVFSDEVMISEEKCGCHVDCTPNGICFEGHCAYFLNG